jgi:aminopeptidase-like protein
VNFERDNTAGEGLNMYQLISRLFPICRSITGNGVRETLAIIREHIPLQILEVPTGTRVFDWVVPREWNIRDAYVANSRGDRVVDFKQSNLHLMSYSVPFRGRMPLGKLREHLLTLPDRPDWIPYRTSYYSENWAFCLSQRQLDSLPDGEYEVCIDSELSDGSLAYGELFVKGSSAEEILISCHICHPSLANDNLSGIALAVSLAKYIQRAERRYSYRLLFIPGTIGAITWLALNEKVTKSIRHGFVLTGVGDSGPLHYKKSRRGDAEIDRAFQHVLRHRDPAHKMLEFSPYGYDERQYCSPGFNLPVGRISRTPHGEFPEYHTSADNLSFVSPDKLNEAFEVCTEVISLLEANTIFVNTNPKCEPQLGKRGLFKVIGGQADPGRMQMAMLWVLNQSDGTMSLLDIAEKSGMNFAVLQKAAAVLRQNQLLRPLSRSHSVPEPELVERT